jgi:hypothetical protein
LDLLSIRGGRAAIERNLQILLRAAWSETKVTQAIVTKLCISSAADKKSTADAKITLSVHNKC